MSTSAISWTEHSWNFLKGCNKISEGCFRCYAERIMFTHFEEFTKLRQYENRLDIPYKRQISTLYFTNSMSDTFHPKADKELLIKAFNIMRKCTQHQFQILTKRPERLLELEDSLNIADNVWLGVSVECNKYYSRIDDLRKSKAKTKFLSLEPLLAPLTDLDLTDIDWVIIGGESGQGARKCKYSWFENIIEQCREKNIPVFVKQMGHRIAQIEKYFWDSKQGENPKDWPEHLNIRQYPKIYEEWKLRTDPEALRKSQGTLF